MTQVIDVELRFPSGSDPSVGARHDRGIADEQIDTAAGTEEPGTECRDRVRIGEVEFVDLDAVHTGQRDRGLAGAAGRHNDVRSGAAQRHGGL